MNDYDNLIMNDYDDLIMNDYDDLIMNDYKKLLKCLFEISAKVYHMMIKYCHRLPSASVFMNLYI